MKLKLGRRAGTLAAVMALSAGAVAAAAGSASADDVVPVNVGHSVGLSNNPNTWGGKIAYWWDLPNHGSVYAQCWTVGQSIGNYGDTWYRVNEVNYNDGGGWHYTGNAFVFAGYADGNARSVNRDSNIPPRADKPQPQGRVVSGWSSVSSTGRGTVFDPSRQQSSGGKAVDPDHRRAWNSVAVDRGSHGSLYSRAGRHSAHPRTGAGVSRSGWRGTAPPGTQVLDIDDRVARHRDLGPAGAGLQLDVDHRMLDDRPGQVQVHPSEYGRDLEEPRYPPRAAPPDPSADGGNRGRAARALLREPDQSPHDLAVRLGGKHLVEAFDPPPRARCALRCTPPVGPARPCRGRLRRSVATDLPTERAPSHSRAAPRRAMPCGAVPCRAVPCRANDANTPTSVTGKAFRQEGRPLVIMALITQPGEPVRPKHQITQPLRIRPPHRGRPANRPEPGPGHVLPTARHHRDGTALRAAKSFEPSDGDKLTATPGTPGLSHLTNDQIRPA
ncbi:hypothetical protein P3T39_007565 [Kitasatospora sp. GP82]|nr:hypothetical protein [Kitasatospora sp. GP82]